MLKLVLSNRKLNKVLLRLFVNLHNFSYDIISSLSVLANNDLHPKHRLMNYHQFFVDNIKESSVVLDLGCGNGALAYDLAEKTKQLVAIDINKKKIEEAKKKYSRNNISYIVGDATKFKFENKFDYIILSNVLEHIQNRIDFLHKIKPLAKVFLIRVPMITRDWLTLYKKEEGFEYRLDKTHSIEYSVDSFKQEMKKARLKVKGLSIQFGEIWAVSKK